MALLVGAFRRARDRDRRPFLGLVAGTSSGARGAVFINCSRTLFQAAAPAAQRGRVLAVYQLGFMGGAPIGTFPVRFAVAALGLHGTLLAAAAVMTVLVAVMASRTATLADALTDARSARGGRAVDKDAIRAFMGRFMEMTTGAAVMGVVAVADRTGLFRAWRVEPPRPSPKWPRTRARRPVSGGDPRDLRARPVWSSTTVRRRPTSCRGHAVCLADETSPYCLRAGRRWCRALPRRSRASRVRAARAAASRSRSSPRDGRGHCTGEPGPEVRASTAHAEVAARHGRRGCRRLAARDPRPRTSAAARARPRSRWAGVSGLRDRRYDVDAHSSSGPGARRASRLRNVSFERCSATRFPASRGFDLVTTFDVVHDLRRPGGRAAADRAALRAGGTYLMVEPVAGDELAENLHPAGALTYAMSTLHCMTQSLAHGGGRLGAAWARGAPRRTAAEAASPLRAPARRQPFNAFYRVTA